MFNKSTKITAFAALIIFTFASCQKMQCYECYTTKFDGTPQSKNPIINCGMTEKGIRKYEQSNTMRQNPNEISPNDIIVTCHVR